MTTFGNTIPQAMHYCHYEEEWKPVEKFHFFVGHSANIKIMSYRESVDCPLQHIPLAVCDDCRRSGRTLASKYSRKFHQLTNGKLQYNLLFS